jgi:hypothetical protein
VFGEQVPHARPHHGLGGQIRGLLAVALLAGAALLLLPPFASANFIYWGNEGQTTIGRAKINGTGANNAFISGLTGVHAVAVDSKFIYWTQGMGPTSSIGRANLDGSGANQNFIPNSAGVAFSLLVAQPGIAVTSSGIYWENSSTGTIGRANIDGSGPNPSLINFGTSMPCGIAADQNFVYWLDIGAGNRIGRAAADGSSPDQNFVTGLSTVAPGCGLAVDPNFLYWGNGAKAVGRVPVGGGSPTNVFVPSAVGSANDVCGVAVNSQFVFWGNSGATDFIGRANLNGGSPNPGLIAGATDPCLMAAAPSNKITVNSVTRKKKKGTATINAKVPGPGQVTLNQTSTPPDVNATAAAVKQQGLTITAASSFKLAVKPVGKTAKKIKKQLKKKRTAKVKVSVFIHFVPAGVAGVANTKQVRVTLVKQRKKK